MSTGLAAIVQTVWRVGFWSRENAGLVYLNAKLGSFSKKTLFKKRALTSMKEFSIGAVMELACGKGR